jgi:hypothetical protein
MKKIYEAIISAMCASLVILILIGQRQTVENEPVPLRLNNHDTVKPSPETHNEGYPKEPDWTIICEILKHPELFLGKAVKISGTKKSSMPREKGGCTILVEEFLGCRIPCVYTFGDVPIEYGVFYGVVKRSSSGKCFLHLYGFE